MAVGSKAVDASGWILQAGLALVGEVEIAIAREGEVVGARETFATRVLDHGRHRARLWIELHHPAAMIGNENAAVLVDGEPVGPSIIFGDDAPDAIGRHPQNAAVGDVG